MCPALLGTAQTCPSGEGRDRCSRGSDGRVVRGTGACGTPPQGSARGRSALVAAHIPMPVEDADEPVLQFLPVLIRGRPALLIQVEVVVQYGKLVLHRVLERHPARKSMRGAEESEFCGALRLRALVPLHDLELDFLALEYG